jgi:arabinogalactan endo-1,4-beta-galactosidase
MTPDLDCKEFKGVKWKSSNPKVLKVTSSGKVTALKKGKATITATSISSGKSSKVKITVIDEIDW